MKWTLVCVCMLAVMMAGSAQANDDHLAGLYIGGKLGASVERFGDGKFGWDGYNSTYNGQPLVLHGGNTGSMGSNKDTVFSGGLNIGYDFSRRYDLPIRLEFDYTLRGDATDETKKMATLHYLHGSSPGSTENFYDVKTSIRLQTAMLNAWYDIQTGTAVTPYVGGGIGVAFVRYKSNMTEIDAKGDEYKYHKSENFSNFAWSLGGGVAYNLNDNWALDVGYRYLDAGDHKMRYKGEEIYIKLDKIESHDIMLGVRYTF